jgi:uncharacterized flavoprotein (TIGR03862 family)
MAAETVLARGHAVTIYDAMPSPARKFLMAGRGGLNLTHSEPLEAFLARYGQADERLLKAIRSFPPEALRAWAEELGQPTFTGSSGRVFPVAMKASPLLRAWLRRLEAAGATLALRHRWTGWDGSGHLVFEAPEGSRTVAAPAAVMALGGASWPRLGSDGAWATPFAESGVSVAPLTASNAGVEIAWSDVFSKKFEGEPVKRVAVTVAGATRRGEAVVTARGLEGGVIYGLSGAFRQALADGVTTASIDLRPDLTVQDLSQRLARPRGAQSLSTFLRKTAGLSPVAIGLLREGGNVPDAASALAEAIKQVPLGVEGIMPIERAISSAGGVRLSEVDARYMLKARPGTFVCGEMLDWDAPTGGYLLQATFATALAAAEGAAAWLAKA